MYVMVGVVNENKLVIDELVSMTVGIIPPEKSVAYMYVIIGRV